MTDLVTVGTLVAGALSLGSEAAKTAVGEAAKEAYQALKAKIAFWASGDVNELEKAPSSSGRKAIIAEIVDGLSKEDREELRNLAQDLTTKLRMEEPAIGLDIGRLDALNVELGKITVVGGIGARIREAHIAGTFKTEEIAVGLPPGKM